MFYSQDILTSNKQSGLAVVWLAATLGPKHSFKKLSKREVNGVNVVKACDFLTSPPEPMALRLTSNLMVGVTRVYSQQYMFFYTEVNQVFLKLKRAWADVQSGHVDMAAPEAKYDAITLQVDEDVELPREQPIMLRSDSVLEKHLDFGWVIRGPDQSSTQSPSTISRSPSGFAPSFSGGASSIETASHVGSLRSITLQDDKLLPAGPFHHRLRDITADLDELNDPLLAPVSERGAPSITAEDQFDLFADIREDHAAVKKKRKILLGAIDDSLEAIAGDVLDFGQAPFDVSAEAQGPAQEPALGQEVSPLEQLAPDVTQIVRPQDIVEARENDNNTQTRRKRKLGLVDTETELSHEDMINMRNRASIDLLLAEKQALAKAKARKDKAFLQTIMEMPSFGLGPDLADFWRSTVVGHKRTSNTALSESAGKRQRGEGNGINRQDSGDTARIDFDIDHNNEPTLGEMGSFGASSGDPSFDDPEMVRAADDRRKSEVMPWQTWHRTSRAGSVTSEQPGSVRKSMSVRDSLSTFGPDEFAFEPMRRSGSIAGSARDLSPLKDVPDAGNINLADDDLPFKEADIHMAAIERETSQFLNYVKDIAHNANTNYVHFFDLLPQNATTRTAASQAFYHVLVLGTRDAIRPTQTGAYEDIRLQLNDSTVRG